MIESIVSGVLEATTAVGTGRIQGGWEYIYAGYAIAWAGMILYALSLWRRRT